MKTIFKRVKSKINNDEAKALANICKKENLQPDQLQAAHTEKEFIWNLIDKNESDLKLSPCWYGKGHFTEKQATEQAMKDLDCTEGNLLPDHNSTHYVFGKVRG